MLLQRIAAVALLVLLLKSPALSADEPGGNQQPDRQSSMLDLVPADACGVLAIRNLEELQRKGDHLVERTGINLGLRPSDMFRQAYAWLGIKEGLDESAPAAAMVLHWDRAEASVVVAIPFSDLDAMAGNFGIMAEELKDGKIVDRKTKRQQWDPTSHVMARGKHFLLGTTPEALKSVMERKTVNDELTKDQRALFGKSDIVAFVSRKGMGDQWKQEVLANFQRALERGDDSPEGRIARELGQAVEHMRIAMMGFSLDDDGAALNAMTLFDENEATRKVFDKLAGGAGSSNVRGLPAEGVVAAYGAGQDGSQQVDIAKALLESTLGGMLRSKQVIAAARRPMFLGVFGEVWRRLKGSRAAIYLNDEPETHGAFSLVGILDTDDPERFLTDMQELATFINHAGQKLTDGVEGIDRAAVEKLIRELGHEEFLVRDSATTKLMLIGEPALPFLEEAAKSNDLEIRTRASRLQTTINAVLEAARKELLSDDLFNQFQPKFVYFPKAEQRGEQPVDIVKVQLENANAQYGPALRHLLGPQWDRIRIAAYGKQLVVLIGSNTPLFEETLANVRQDRPGLAGVREVTAFDKRSGAGRKVEFHLSLARVIWAVKQLEQQEPVDNDFLSGLSSMAMSIGGARIQLDAFVPYSEIKAAQESQR